ncbi:peptidoglycan-binding protein, partial [Candidatus Kaiserbacteria bacterium]|nr:peptidoglycan-binding protein [Candidatus Kaiserbacteria bacterium]
MRAIRMAILSIGVALLFGVVPAAVSHAQTLQELQAQLNQLLRQLSSLQQQQASGVVPNASPIAAPISSSSCFYTNRSLRLGSQGDDVVALQRFLAADSSLYPEGAISGYFGALTQAAIQRFQIRYGIVSSGTPDSTGFGAVGPATRNKISMLCGGSVGGTVGGTVISPPSQTSCFVGGLTIPSGGTIQMYSINSAPLGASCTLYGQIRQCINGILTGSPSYQYTSCSSTTAPIRLGCTVGNVSMAEGETRTFFLSQLVPYGGTCTWQGRTCLNGTLSGGSGFQYTSCVVSTVPSSCTQDGVTISHGQSATFYAEKNVNFGQFCA